MGAVRRASAGCRRAAAAVAVALLGLAGAGCNDVPFFTDVPEKRRPVAVIDPVLVAETGGPVAAFDSFVAYEAGGEGSYDPDGEVVEWRWRVLQRPAGSGMSIVASEAFEDARRATFRPDLPGAYTIELVVVDDDGLESDPVEYSFSVTSSSGLLLELTWDRDYTDVDLHLVMESAGGTFFEEPYDCYFQNRNPDWGVPGYAADDPLLPEDIDGGFGPEIIGLREPAPGTYRVWSHYYCDDGFGGTNATVKLYYDGALLAETSASLLSTGKLWDVASLVVASDGTPSLVVSSAGVAESDRGCE